MNCTTLSFRTSIAVIGAIALVATSAVTAHAGVPSTASLASATSDMVVSRIAGADRYAVANQVSAATYPAGADTVYVVAGANFPDALSAGPAAIAQGAPLLLVAGGSLPASVRAEIVRLSPTTVVIVGGPASVSASVESTLRTLAPTVRRIGGADRYEASRAVARYAFGGGAVTSYIATGRNYPDALSAGSVAGAAGGPVILIDGAASTAKGSTTDLIDGLGTSTIKVAGGPASVTNGLVDSLRGSADTVTRLDGPDRIAASIAINADGYATSRTAYLATGYNFPDALVGAVLASKKRAPLFLVPSNCVPDSVLAQFERMGTTSVVLLGGEASLSGSVAALTPCTTVAQPVVVPPPVAPPVASPVAPPVASPVAPPVAPAVTPPRTGVPSASNTGVIPGTELTVHNGDMRIKVAGTVVNAMDVRGRIFVDAPNVTIKNSIVRGPAGGITTPGALITATGGFPNLVISDVELAPTAYSGWINGIIGHNFTATRLNIHHVIDGVHITGSNSALISSWVHDHLHYLNDPNQGGTPSHDDSIQVQVGDNIRIQNNHLSSSKSAAMQVTQGRGIVSNLIFSGNFADNGACTVNIAESGKGPIVGISVSDNTFGVGTRLSSCAVISPTTTKIAMSNNFYTTGTAVTVRRG